MSWVLEHTKNKLNINSLLYIVYKKNTIYQKLKIPFSIYYVEWREKKANLYVFSTFLVVAEYLNILRILKICFSIVYVFYGFILILF